MILVRRYLIAVSLASVFLGPGALAEVILMPQEITQALSHGPWPQELTSDPSNRVSGNAAAIALGEALFGDVLLSHDGAMSCASCHNPARDFAEDKQRAMGRVLLDRNTPSLKNPHVYRWFGWGGTGDNLWGQSILPIVNPDELGRDALSLKTAIVGSSYVDAYAEVFGAIDPHEPQEVLVNIGKVLAAYQETLVTGRTPFDRFRDALEESDEAAAANYPETAQRGLQIFIGKGRCVFCHTGPAFTNSEFHDAGVPYFLERGRVDPGRYAGLKTLFESPFTLDGAFNDDPEKAGAWAVRGVRTSHADFGTFRVPSLRGVSQTAPYMHDGSLADLEAVINHYNTINTERLHADGEAILEPLELNDREVADLLAFLESLSD